MWTNKRNNREIFYSDTKLLTMRMWSYFTATVIITTTTMTKTRTYISLFGNKGTKQKNMFS